MTAAPRAVRQARRRSGLAVAAVLLTLVSGCALAVGENVTGGGAINIHTVPLIDVDARPAAPDVCGETLQGEPLCLEDLRGAPILVNFWASWCGPCAREVPELVEVADRYAGRVDLVGVNLQDTAVNARSFERDQRVNYPSLFDDDALIAARFGGIAPEALPSTILIDSEFRVAVRLFGAVSQNVLSPYLDALVAES